MTTISNLTYEPLFAVLREKGFHAVPNRKARVFVQEETGAELILPVVAEEEPLRAHHYVLAQATLDDWGILSRDAFDLALLRAAETVTSAPSLRVS